MSPDVLNLASESSTMTCTYNAEKSDIWSMGIILYKMLYGKEPYNGKDEEQMIKVISEKELAFPDTAKISPEVIKNTNVSS
jgi:serine/threonine protein kinase